ncbi:MAG TPA: amidohydrolase family protein [Candidatus Binataceae bacterium]|nr:amidohydrolase family protein [Candidatus Binataceae bacterium]
MHDLVIRNGKIVDGTGKPAFVGDIAIDGNKITSVGGTAGAARREIDATGLLVTPGFVDIHTHYDGQVTWDPYLTPSSWHGVTTLVMGNCGVGFAPVEPGKEEFLIGLMEGVEDIPGTALAEGIKWGWESFPEYMNAVEKMKRAVDVGVQVPHGSVRAYVMGERGAHNEQATPDDIERMAAVVCDGIRAGALGFTTSRTMLHRAKNKELVPGTFASEDELLGIGRALGQAGHGVFEMASDMVGPDATMEWMVKLSSETGLPITFAIAQNDKAPNGFRKMLERVKQFNASGAHLAPQISARPTGLLMGLESSLHPFITHPTYKTIAHLPIDERVAKLRDPEIRARILSESPSVKDKATLFMVTNFAKYFPLGDPPDYEPTRDSSVAARAERFGKSPAELTYDLMLERDGRALLYMPLGNYAEYNHDALREMLLDPMTTLGLSDGGAHCGLICDASMPSYMLSHWVRGRSRGERIPVETAVRLQTSDTAKLYGLRDRGILAPGMKADVNVIDLDALKLHAPQMVFDLPAGGRRLIQRAEGYRYTVLSGEVTFKDGVPTEAMPGKLVRGPQADPRATA